MRFSKNVFPVLALALLALSPASSRADSNKGALRVFVDCFLNTAVPCQQLENAYFILDTRSERVDDARAADIVAKIRAWNVGNYEQYTVELKGREEIKPFSLPEGPLKIDASYTAEAKTQTLAHHLVNGVSVFYKIAKVESDAEGRFLVSYAVNPSNNPAANNSDTPWIYTASASGSFAVNGSTVASINGAGSVMYDTPTWYAVINAGGAYNYIQVTTEGVEQKAENIRANVGVGAGRTVFGHWSILVMARATHDPSSNYKMRAQGHAGIEYELIPFRESNDDAFTVSYLLGGNHERYITENIQSRMSANLATHAVSAYFVKHIAQKVNLSGAAAVTALVDKPKRYAVGGNATIQFILSQNLSLNLNGTVGYKANLINAPRDASKLNPLLNVVGAGSGALPINYTLGVSLTYTGGNVVLQQKDTRWTYTPDTNATNF